MENDIYTYILRIGMTVSGTDEEVGDVSEHGYEDVHERLIENATAHAVFMLSHDGRIGTWPAMAERLYGYREETVVGRKLSFLFADQEGAAAGLADLLDEATDAGVETQHWHERADGTVFWATTTVSPMRNATGGYTVVGKDTTSQKQYERMLERQNDRLKEFTDILSHDLRSPLAVVSGRLDLYLETGDRDHLDAIGTTVDRMGRLIEDLLRIARRGAVVERPERTDLGKVVETAWEGPSDAAATLEYEPVPGVTADADRLCEMFENLFRNSVEHGRSEDGTVAVRVGPLEDGFYVEDDGPGVREEHRDEVFDNGFTTAADGSGFGLSVVRTIVGAHGWDVHVVESDSGGARFEVTGVEFVGCEE
jgi:PAS domain S-box-containing protein